MTSASRTNTRLTSGRSRPSLNRLTPTTALISPTCKFCKTWALSVAFRSEWMYEQRTPPSSCRYVVISSASRLLTVRMMVFSFLSSCDASWRSTSSRTPSFLECTEITGSRQKVGRMTISGTSTGRPAPWPRSSSTPSRGRAALPTGRRSGRRSPKTLRWSAAYSPSRMAA